MRHLCLTLLVLACACGRTTPAGPKKIDGTSAESFRTSVDAMKADLSPDDRAKFERAMLIMAASIIEGGNRYAMYSDPEGAQRRLRDRLDGMTFAEFMDEQGRVMGVLQEARKRGNEVAAIATLRNIASAQAQTQASGIIDADQDGVGEYGYFAEMSGAVPVRGKDTLMNPPVLSTAFRAVTGGCAQRSGYMFQIYLPGADGAAVAESSRGGAGESVDADLSEVVWCCYAWPLEPGVTGRRAFFVNQMGDIVECENKAGRYAGPEKAPSPLAAFASDAKDLTGNAALGVVGRDGERWTVVR